MKLFGVIWELSVPRGMGIYGNYWCQKVKLNNVKLLYVYRLTVEIFEYEQLFSACQEWDCGRKEALCKHENSDTSVGEVQR